jgi:carboxymethylenebutenolidase
LSGFLAEPKGKPRGGVVVCHEVWGVTDYIRSTCESFAAEGYASVAPAIYDRQKRDLVFTAEQYEAARAHRARLVWDDVIKDVGAAVKHLSAFGKVGAVGYCLGGSVAWLAAAHLPVAAASSYYGRDIAGWLDQHVPRCPMVVHFGRTDDLIKSPDVARIKARHPDMPIHVYDAGHAFDNSTRDSFVAEAATVARERTLALFHSHIG